MINFFAFDYVILLDTENLIFCNDNINYKNVNINQQFSYYQRINNKINSTSKKLANINNEQNFNCELKDYSNNKINNKEEKKNKVFIKNNLLNEKNKKAKEESNIIIDNLSECYKSNDQIITQEKKFMLTNYKMNEINNYYKDGKLIKSNNSKDNKKEENPLIDKKDNKNSDKIINNVKINSYMNNLIYEEYNYSNNIKKKIIICIIVLIINQILFLEEIKA